MFKIRNNWSFKKHVIFSLILSVSIEIIKYVFVNRNDAAAIGIIGGADGPTAIFLGNKMLSPLFLLTEFSIVLSFIILLVLYKPTKYLIEKYIVSN